MREWTGRAFLVCAAIHSSFLQTNATQRDNATHLIRADVTSSRLLAFAIRLVGEAHNKTMTENRQSMDGNDQQQQHCGGGGGGMIRGRDRLGYVSAAADDTTCAEFSDVETSRNCAHTTSGNCADTPHRAPCSVTMAAAPVGTAYHTDMEQASRREAGRRRSPSRRSSTSRRTATTTTRTVTASTSSSRSMLLFAVISFLFLASMAPPPTQTTTTSSLLSDDSTVAVAGSGVFGAFRLAAYAANGDDDGDDGADQDEEDNQDVDDNALTDDFADLSDISFDEVSVMPVSCLRYNNGHMIKFEFFENTSNYQCHFKNLGTFVVSIAHFMRAYFNHQALVKGRDFKL